MVVRGPKASMVSQGTFSGQDVHRLLAGDREAGRSFVRRFEPLLRTKIRCRWPRTPEPQIADFIQETFRRVLEALQAGRVKDLDRLGGFVAGVCENVMFEGHAATKRLVALDDVAQGLLAPGDPEDRATVGELVEMARQVVRELPDREREVLQLILEGEVDREEVCRRYQITRENLRIILWRAREKLREAVRSEPSRSDLKNRA